jgi:hypothetical protein
VGKFQDQRYEMMMMKVREGWDDDDDVMKWVGFVGCEEMKEFEL